MQGRKLFSLSALMILLALCFISVPGVAGDHPWDIDSGDDNRDIRDVEIPDTAQAKTLMGLESTSTGSSGTTTSLLAMPPAVQFIVEFVFRSWTVRDIPIVEHSTRVQPEEMSRIKRSIR